MHPHAIDRTFSSILITDIVNVTMDDGAPIRTSVKVDTILAHFGLEHLPDELKRLMGQGVIYRSRRSKTRG